MSAARVNSDLLRTIWFGADPPKNLCYTALISNEHHKEKKRSWQFTKLSSEFDLGALFGNAVGATFNTAFGRDCKGRPQGDYFFGCQVIQYTPIFCVPFYFDLAIFCLIDFILTLHILCSSNWIFKSLVTAVSVRGWARSCYFTRILDSWCFIGISWMDIFSWNN